MDECRALNDHQHPRCTIQFPKPTRKRQAKNKSLISDNNCDVVMNGINLRTGTNDPVKALPIRSTSITRQNILNRAEHQISTKNGTETHTALQQR